MMTLTPRQTEILAMRCDGKSINDVALALYLSPATVKGYLTEIYRRLNIDGGTATNNGYKAILACKWFWLERGK